MKEGLNHENERREAAEKELSKIREILNKAKNTENFDWEETSDDFILKFGKIEKTNEEVGPDYKQSIHIPKWKEIVVSKTSNTSRMESLEDIVRAFLENPEAGIFGNIGKTIEGFDKNEKTDSIEE